jgi:hypothetical protein
MTGMPNDISAGRMRVDEVTEEPVFALFAVPRDEINIEFSKSYETRYRYQTFSYTSTNRGSGSELAMLLSA